VRKWIEQDDRRLRGDWEAEEQLPWEPKTPKEEREGKAYARGKTLVRYANAGGAFIADLLVAAANKRSEGWLQCSHRKTDYTGKYVKWATFDGVRKSMA